MASISASSANSLFTGFPSGPAVVGSIADLSNMPTQDFTFSFHSPADITDCLICAIVVLGGKSYASQRNDCLIPRSKRLMVSSDSFIFST